MSAFYILIGVSIPIALGFLIAFIISAKRGQFDDDYTPSIRMLMEDTPAEQSGARRAEGKQNKKENENE